MLAPLRVLGLQLAATPGDLAGNLHRAAAAIRAHPGYHLYVLPELSCNGYGDSVLAALEDHAQDALTGEAAVFFGHVAREVDAHVCFGLLRRQETASGSDGRGAHYSICQAVSAPDGRVALMYDKMHLCDMGQCSEMGHGLGRGDTPGVFSINGWRIGVTICYDVRFPELWRRLAWDERCDLIVHPSAFVRDATFACYQQFVTTRAVENGVYVLSVNHAGAQFGDSLAVPPWVGPVPGLKDDLAAASLGIEEGVLPLLVDPAHLAAVRRAYPYRRDLNPALRSPSQVSLQGSQT